MVQRSGERRIGQWSSGSSEQNTDDNTDERACNDLNWGVANQLA